MHPIYAPVAAIELDRNPIDASSRKFLLASVDEVGLHMWNRPDEGSRHEPYVPEYRYRYRRRTIQLPLPCSTGGPEAAQHPDVSEPMVVADIAPFFERLGFGPTAAGPGEGPLEGRHTGVSIRNTGVSLRTTGHFATFRFGPASGGRRSFIGDLGLAEAGCTEPIETQQRRA